MWSNRAAVRLKLEEHGLAIADSSEFLFGDVYSESRAGFFFFVVAFIDPKTVAMPSAVSRADIRPPSQHEQLNSTLEPSKPISDEP